MSISKQIEYLKKLSDIMIYDSDLGAHECEFQDAIREAADTIESLTAKLQAANVERSADCGGWIPCKERMPDTRNNILICQRDGYVSVGYFQHYKGFIDLNSVLFDDVIAWRPLPEPYHEP